MMGGCLLLVSALLLLAVNHLCRFYRPLRTPLLERLGLPGIALVLLALAAILFAVVFRHPRRLLAVSLVGILAFGVLNLVSRRHVLPDVLIWPSPRALSEQYVQALAADDLEAALKLAHPSHECHQITTQQFLDQRAQLAESLGDGWSGSDYRHPTAKRITSFCDYQMPQQPVHVQVETEAGTTAWLTLRMRYQPVMGARYMCGTVIDSETSPMVGAGTTAAPPASGLSATLEAPSRLPDGERVAVRFTLTNDSDAERYVLTWYTPLEGIGGEIFRVERDGQAVPYTGILAMRGDPTPEGYIRLPAGQSASAEIDLATSFDLSKPGEYTIEFLSPRISHVARSEAEMARSVDDLGPVDIPANTVTVEIGGPTDGQAATLSGGGLVHYVGTSAFLPESQSFEVDYCPSLWEHVPGNEPNQADQLRHREMAGCSLWLGGGDVGVTPVSSASLAGYEWTIAQVLNDRLQYLTRWDTGVFTFDLILPQGYRSGVKETCQRSAEDVLGTIKVIHHPLPHSMKGYELYSWFAREEDQWYHALITGTDRLKTLAELRDRPSVVRPDGWVSILVRGTGPLKALLRRLPDGERLTWVGEDWLMQAGADQEMIATMALPDAQTVREIEDLCRELGLSLYLTEALAPKPKLMFPSAHETLTPVCTAKDGQAARLLARETPHATATVIGLGRFEYDIQLGDHILTRIEEQREQSAERSLAQSSAALAAFGYRLESRFDAGRNRVVYDLYREGEG
jgi:hypothetical protein